MIKKNLIVVHFASQITKVSVLTCQDRSEIVCKTLPNELSTQQLYNNAEQQGKLLKDILAEHSVKTKNALFIVDSKDVLARKLTIPPISDPTIIKSIIFSSLERQTKLHSENIAIGYTGDFNPQTQCDILVAVILKEKLQKLCSIAEYAKLKLCSVVPDFQVVCNELKDNAPESFIVSQQSNASIITADNGLIKDVRHVPVSKNSTETPQKIASEINRNRLLTGGPGANEITLFADDPNLKEQLAALLPDDCAIKNNSDDNTNSVGYVLGKYHLLGKNCDIDFLQSHLKVKKENRLKEHLSKIVILAAFVFILICWFFISWQMDKNAIADLKVQHENIAPKVADAQKLIDKITYAKSWYDTAPLYTECMNQITQAFSDSSSIWTSSLAINSDFVAVMTGRSVGEQNVITFLDQLKSSGHFSDIKMLYMRQASKNSSQVSFAINFKYQGSK